MPGETWPREPQRAVHDGVPVALGTELAVGSPCWPRPSSPGFSVVV